MDPDPDPDRTPTNSRAQPQPQRNHLAHAASLARTHARNAIATETEIDFPVWGWAKAGLTTPNLRYRYFGVRAVIGLSLW